MDKSIEEMDNLELLNQYGFWLIQYDVSKNSNIFDKILTNMVIFKKAVLDRMKER